MTISPRDRRILRELAAQVAEVAALPVQQETIALWKANNGLRPVRPMVMIDQVCWHEMNVDGELTCQIESHPWRGVEEGLRRTLYSWKHMRADMVVEAAVEIGKVVRGGGFGIEVAEDVSVLDPQNDVVGHAYHDQLQTEEDLKKITDPVLELDEKATAEVEEQAHDVFDGLLEVRMVGASWFQFAPWDILATWRSPEHLIYDLVDRPEFTHRIMARLTEVSLCWLDQLEALGLLPAAQRTIHCTGAWTDELPAPGFDPRKPRARDLWTNGQAQIFSTVSPAMHKEFWLTYAAKWYSRFGLGYYGCCEPLDGKVDVVREMLPNVRKISMSPWVDVERGAAKIGRHLVFSRKPSPAFLARDPWDPVAVEADLRETLAACQRRGCALEFILKDISTVNYQPQRLWEWAEVAKRVVGG